MRTPTRPSVDHRASRRPIAYRIRVLLVRTLVLLVSLLGAGALAVAPATASAPSAPLTAEARPDGLPSLRWTLSGSSDSVNVLPHLRCAADPTATGPFAGAKVPCLWLVDHKAAPLVGPAGCPGTGEPFASWRCDMRAFRDLVIDAAFPGEQSLVNFNTKAKGGSGICAWIPVALRVNGGEGTILAADGCAQRISCVVGSTGTVTVDAFDTVSGCPKVARAGSSSGSSNASGGNGTSQANVDLSTCTGAGTKPFRISPLYDIRTTKRGRRGINVRVTLRRAVPYVVQIRRRTSFGTLLVREIARCGKAGSNRFSVGDATAGRRQSARYQLVVRSPRSSYPLRSSDERLPR